jgi:hypothetical protein
MRQWRTSESRYVTALNAGRPLKRSLVHPIVHKTFSGSHSDLGGLSLFAAARRSFLHRNEN